MSIDDSQELGRPIYLSHLMERAQTFVAKAKLDEAATTFDGALSEGMHAIDRLADPSGFISAHIARAAIAFARNEPARVGQLLDRVVRYDPTASISGDEQRPRMNAALEAAKKRLGPRPTLTNEDLGDACHTGDVVVVARALDPSAFGSSPSTGILEYLRFDRCRLVATATSERGDDAAVAALLVPLMSDLSDAPPVNDQPVRPRGRIYKAPLVLGLSALALGITGAGLSGWAHSEYNQLHDTCGNTGTCTVSSYDAARSTSRAGYALIGLSGATFASALIVWLVERRPNHPVAPSARSR